MKWQKAKFADFFRVKHGFAFKSEFFDTAGPYALLTQLKTLKFQTQKLRTGRDPLLPRLMSGEIAV